MKKLLELYGLTEGPFDDVNNQLGSAQSLRGGPRTEPSVRKHQDRSKRYTPSVGSAQSDIDSATSVVKKEELSEAGIENEPTGKLRKKWKSFSPRIHEPEHEPEDAGEFSDEPEEEPERDVPFASKPAKPSPALQGGKSAGSMKVDKLTLNALEMALESVRTGDDNLQDWIDDLLSEIGRAIRSGGELTLPKFEATPDDVDDDEAGSEDEEY